MNDNEAQNAIADAAMAAAGTQLKKVKAPMTEQNKNVQLAQLAVQAGRSFGAVVDAMAQRGAVKGEEMLAIGQLREQANQMVSIAEGILSDAAAEEQKTKK